MQEKLLKTVTRLGSPKVLVVGDFMLDAYIYGDALRISPEAPVPVLKVSKTEYRLGGAGRVTTSLADLGAVPYCLGIIGDDHNGKTLKKMLTEAGADITGLLVAKDRPTISKQRLIGLAQHRHRQQLIRMDQESTEPLSCEQSEEILRIYKDRVEEVDIVCLQDYDKGLLGLSVCKQMIELVAKAKKKVLVDPCLTDDYSKYIGATVITPNRKEASLAVGFGITNPQAAAKAAEELFENLKLEAVVITLDKEGAYLKTRNLSELEPTRARNVYDVTGAGDTVLATLAVTLAADCDYKTAVQLCNITGGIEVEKFGYEPVTIEEIINEIISEHRGKSGKMRSSDSLLDELTWHRSQNNTIIYDRAAVLAALETVDYITVFDEPDPLNLIKEVKPDVLVKGHDWAEKGVVGREFVESYGGKVVLAPLVEGKSSTAIIEKMKAIWKSR